MNYEKIKKEVISPCGPGAESLGKPLQLSEQSLGSKRISQHLVRVQVQQSIALLYQNLKPLRHDHPEQERGRRFPGDYLFFVDYAFLLKYNCFRTLC